MKENYLFYNYGGNISLNSRSFLVAKPTDDQIVNDVILKNINKKCFGLDFVQKIVNINHNKYKIYDLTVLIKITSLCLNCDFSLGYFNEKNEDYFEIDFENKKLWLLKLNATIEETNYFIDYYKNNIIEKYKSHKFDNYYEELILKLERMNYSKLISMNNIIE